ncbi:MAG TPA: tetratricopeptide repeat-containing sensor histidine kinase [Prolixibacteraceae bacterium]|nr:tetratricopeptide repeat-containing sensor histidine kinase [Prolixibacteraceae bacterium]
MRKDFIIRCLFFCLLLQFSVLLASGSRIDSLQLVLKDSKLSVSEKLSCYELLGEEFENNYQAAEAASAYQNALNLCRKLEKEEDKLSGLLYQYAVMATYAGDYSNAISALDETLKLTEQHPNDVLRARTLMQTGLVYFFQQKWNEALYFYQQALGAAEKLKNKEGISIAYNNIANIYQKQLQPKKAFNYYGKALEIQRELADSAAMCNCLMNIASNHLEQNQLREVSAPLNEALDIAEKIGDNEIIALSYMHLGVLYSKTGQMNKATEMLKQAEILALNTGYERVRQEILHTASNIYFEAKEYKPAYEYLKKSQTLGDTLMNQQMLEKTQEFEISYKSKENESELTLYKQQLKALHQQQIFHAIIVLLLILLIVSLVINQKRNRIQNRKLKDLNETKDKLFSIISHDLKSPAMAQKVAIDTMIQRADQYDAETLVMLTSFNNAAESQLSLLQNLLNWANIQTGKMMYSPIKFNLCETMAKSIELYAVSAKNKGLQFVSDMPDNCMVQADRQMINTVVRNLLNNAVKFSKPAEIIRISISCHNSYMRVSIIDKGVGMPQQQIDELLTDGKSTSKDGTQGEKGSGLGLIICKELLEKNNSRLEIESNENEGTVFSFNLPKV